MRCEEPLPAAASIAVRDLLEQPAREGVVVAAGPMASYVGIDGSSDVVALVTPRAIQLPIALQVCALPGISAGDRAVVGDGLVRVGLLCWRPVRWWDPHPRVDVGALLTAGPLLAALVAELPLTSYGVDPGAALDAVIRLVFADAVGACGLLGSGVGFTPAGDDVIAGALVALQLTARLDPAARDRVLETARDRTTSLSAALLVAAARGDAVPQVSRLLTALTTGAALHDVRARLQALLAVGATSGAALALGLAGALATHAATAAEMERT